MFRSGVMVFILCIISILTSSALGVCPDSPEHFEYTDETGGTYSIVVEGADLWFQGLEIGDEIGIFDGDLCVGAACWQDPPVGITVWQDDSQTGLVDGYICGHEMSFRIWDNSRGIVRRVKAHCSVGDGRFCTGAYSMVTLMKRGPEPFKIPLAPAPVRNPEAKSIAPNR